MIGSAYVYNSILNKLEVVDKDWVVKTYLSCPCASLVYTTKQTESLSKKSYVELFKTLNLVKVTDKLKYFQNSPDEICIIGLDVSIDKIKKWLKMSGYVKEFNGCSDIIKSLLKKYKYKDQVDNYGFYEEKGYGLGIKPKKDGKYEIRNNTEYRCKYLPGANTGATEEETIKAILVMAACRKEKHELTNKEVDELFNETTTKYYYILNINSNSYVRNYNDMGTPPIKSTKDKKEAKLYSNLQLALNDAKEMDELNVGDFVVKDFMTNKTVEGLDYSEGLFKDKTIHEGIILYHGAVKEIIGKPKVHYEGASKINDFGWCFYVGEMEEQAKNRINQSPEATLYKYLLNTNKYRMYEFTDDNLWALFIAYNRQKLNFSSYPKILNKLKEIGKYDIIKGYIADDKIANTYTSFLNGDTTDVVLKESLKLIKYGKQYAINNQEIIDKEFLYEIEHKKLTKEERKEALLWGQNLKKNMEDDLEKIKLANRRNGKFIEEVLNDYEQSL